MFVDFSVALSASVKKHFFLCFPLTVLCVCVCLFPPPSPFQRGPNLLLLSFVLSEDLERELRILLVEVLFFLFVFFWRVFEGLRKKMQAVRMQPNAVVSTAQKYGGSCCCSSRETYCSMYMPRSSFTSTEVPFFIFLLSCCCCCCCCLTFCLCFTRFFCVGNSWESACKVP